MSIYVGEIQYQDSSGIWNGVQWTSLYPNDFEIFGSMQHVAKLYPGHKVRCIDRDSGRLVDILQ